MMETIRIEKKILAKNDDIAAENRRSFQDLGVFVVTLTGSPGSGKTSLLERTVVGLRSRMRVAVMEGDVETDRDAKRIDALDIPVVQIITNGTCHLNAGMVQNAMGRLPLESIDLLFIENVGNLVCPASYGLGEHIRVVVMSTTEGDDKPVKYPAMFRKADAAVINKMDLLPYVSSNPADARGFARLVNPSLEIFETSCVSGQGIPEWTEWLCNRKLCSESARSSV
jgi:hydrogenase nickel incorporation protein HypB